MDTSPEYILQCQKAEEIQKEWKPALGDCFYSRYSNLSVECNFHWIGGDSFTTGKPYYEDIYGKVVMGYKDTEIIWLPRQDQLQEMVQGDDLSTKLMKFYYFVKQYNFNGNTPFMVVDSYEKAWLIYVMKERFNKVWDGKEWVKG